MSGFDLFFSALLAGLGFGIGVAICAAVVVPRYTLQFSWTKRKGGT